MRIYQIIFPVFLFGSFYNSAHSSPSSIKTCITKINDFGPKSLMDAETFNITFNTLIKGEGKSGITLNSFSLLAQGKLTLEALQKDYNQFYESYRANARYLEEYSTELNRRQDPFLITRYHSRYRWLVDAILLKSKAPISSSAILQEMAQVNQWIVDEKLGGLPPDKTIISLDSDIIGSAELRAAVYLELKLHRNPITRDEVLKRFEELKKLNIKYDGWAKIDSIVISSNGTLSFKEALDFVRRLESHSALPSSSPEMKQNAALVIETLQKMNLPLTEESLTLLETGYQTFKSQAGGSPPSLILFLHFFRVSPLQMKMSDLLKVLEFAKEESQKSQAFLFRHSILKAHEAIALIYLNSLPLNERQFMQLSQMHRSIKVYRAIFSENEAVNWIKEERFLQTLNP